VCVVVWWFGAGGDDDEEGTKGKKSPGPSNSWFILDFVAGAEGQSVGPCLAGKQEVKGTIESTPLPNFGMNTNGVWNNNQKPKSRQVAPPRPKGKGKDGGKSVFGACMARPLVVPLLLIFALWNRYIAGYHDEELTYMARFPACSLVVGLLSSSFTSTQLTMYRTCFCCNGKA